MKMLYNTVDFQAQKFDDTMFVYESKIATRQFDPKRPQFSQILLQGFELEDEIELV